MRNISKGLSVVVAVALIAQPVFANDFFSEELILSISEEVTIDLNTDATLDTSVSENPNDEETIVPEIVTVFEEIPQTEAIAEVVAPSPRETKGDFANDFYTQKKDGARSEYVADQVLVKYKIDKINLGTSDGRNAASSFANAESLESVEMLEESNISVLEIEDGETVEEKIAELKRDPNIEYAQPNFQYHLATIDTDDTFKDVLWGLHNTGQTIDGDYWNDTGTPDSDIDAPEAWSINEGTNADVIVAIIDIGVAYNHPDLLPNMWDGSSCEDENGDALGGCMHGYDFQSGDKNPVSFDSSHGTHVAGIIVGAKNNGRGIMGVAPQAKIMAIKSNLDTANIVQGINFAKENGAKVINASWGGSTFDAVLYDAIDAFPGLFIAAAGNSARDNESTHFYPSDFDLDNIISVTATDQDDELAPFGSFGATSVDVGAPGINIYSTGAEVVTLEETFEDVVVDETTPLVPDGWSTDGTSNNWGVDFLESDKVLFTDLEDTTYSNNADTSVVTSGIDLSGATAAIVSFNTQCDTEYDTAFWTDYIELYSTNESASNLIARWDEAVIDNNVDETGSSPIVPLSFPVSSEHFTDDVRFEFAWHTDEDNNAYEGCLIDDVVVKKFSDGEDERYMYMSGTSMATPYVTGLAALLMGYNNDLTPRGVKNVILSTGDDVASLSGRTVTGKRINAHTALTLADPTSTTPPVVTLLGGETMSVAKGTIFTDPGATAHDAVDGDLTSVIIVTGAVDVDTVGTYTLTYTVTDTAGNTASVDRTVSVTDLVISGEQASGITTESVTLTWTTSHPATSRVIWDTTSHGDVEVVEAGPVLYGYTNSNVENATLVTNHSVTVNGLTPSTQYFFRPVSHGSPETVGSEVSATTEARRSGGGGGGGGGGGSGSKKTYAVQINNGAGETSSSQVTLTIAPVNSVREMQVSNTVNFTGAAWIPFQSTYPWALNGGAGVKTVYVRYAKNGRAVGDAQDRITLLTNTGVTPFPPTPSVPLLGATTRTQFLFTSPQQIGTRNQDVTELQKILIAQKHLNLGAPTGYFGPVTAFAVMAFQRASGLQANGIVGPETMKVLNALPVQVPGTSTPEKELLIKALLAKIAELTAQLKAMQ